MSDRDIHIGGDSIGSVNITGNENVVFNSYEKVTLPDPATVDINQALENLRKELAKLVLMGENYSEITEAMEQAEKEARADNPDKKTIGGHVEKAITIAQKANNFVDVAKKAGSHLADAAAWLGENWYKLLPLVGLQV